MILYLGLRWVQEKENYFVQVCVGLIQSYHKKNQIPFGSDSVIYIQQQNNSAFQLFNYKKYTLLQKKKNVNYSKRQCGLVVYENTFLFLAVKFLALRPKHFLVLAQALYCLTA